MTDKAMSVDRFMARELAGTFMKFRPSTHDFRAVKVPADFKGCYDPTWAQRGVHADAAPERKPVTEWQKDKRLALALAWLQARGGDGVIVNGSSHRQTPCIRVLAQGELAPFLVKTFRYLESRGKVEFYGNNRVRVVA